MKGKKRGKEREEKKKEEVWKRNSAVNTGKEKREERLMREMRQMRRKMKCKAAIAKALVWYFHLHKIWCL